MKIKKIVISGANEYTEIDSLLRLMSKYPKAEIGIQVSATKAYESSARYWWINALYYALQATKEDVSVALHINTNWVENFGEGLVAPEIENWLNFCPLNNGEPFIKRVQLNFKVGRERKPSTVALRYAMSKFPNQRFIIPYNKENAKVVKEMHKYGIDFDCLYDGSSGEAVLPKERLKPVFNENVLQGYAGGISAENVYAELNKISKVVPKDREIFIDAEGKLKGLDRHLSLDYAEEYLRCATLWDKKHNG